MSTPTAGPALSAPQQPAAMPEFATVLRGYDRGQVDDYVRRLQDFLADEERRAARAEQTAAELGQQLQRSQQELGEALKRPPVPDSPYAGLGERVEAILRLADEEAKVVADRGRAGAEELLAEAREAVAREHQRAEADLAEVAHRRDNVVNELRRVQDVLASLGLRAAIPDELSDGSDGTAVTRVVRLPDAAPAAH